MIILFLIGLLLFPIFAIGCLLVHLNYVFIGICIIIYSLFK